MSRRVYLSSSSLSGRRIGEVVEDIARAGITDIKLSGGTAFYRGLEEDLQRLKGERLEEQTPMPKRTAEGILYNNIRSLMSDMVTPDFRFAVENMYPGGKPSGTFQALFS